MLSMISGGDMDVEVELDVDDDDVDRVVDDVA